MAGIVLDAKGQCTLPILSSPSSHPLSLSSCHQQLSCGAVGDRTSSRWPAVASGLEFPNPCDEFNIGSVMFYFMIFFLLRIYFIYFLRNSNHGLISMMNLWLAFRFIFSGFGSLARIVLSHFFFFYKSSRDSSQRCSLTGANCQILHPRGVDNRHRKGFL